MGAFREFLLIISSRRLEVILLVLSGYGEKRVIEKYSYPHCLSRGKLPLMNGVKPPLMD